MHFSNYELLKKIMMEDWNVNMHETPLLKSGRKDFLYGH